MYHFWRIVILIANMLSKLLDTASHLCILVRNYAVIHAYRHNFNYKPTTRTNRRK